MKKLSFVFLILSLTTISFAKEESTGDDLSKKLDGLNIPSGNIDSTNNRFSILLSYDLPYGIFSKNR